MKLKIKAVSPKIGTDIPAPFYATPGSAAMDLHACVDGPDFDGHLVDYDDAMRRGVKEAVGSLIVNFGSYGKAPLVEQKSLEDMIAFYKK